MDECVLPATGVGVLVIGIGFVLVAVGVALLGVTRRVRPLLLIALVTLGGLVVADPVAASPADCATTTTAAGEGSPPGPPTEPGGPSGFTPPPTPPATTAGAALSVSNRSPSAGDSITVTGLGFPTGTQIAVVLYSDPVPLGGSESGSDGGFSMSVTIPAGTNAGVHTLAAFGGRAAATVELDIGGAPPASSKSPPTAVTMPPTTTTAQPPASTTPPSATTVPTTSTTSTSTPTPPTSTTIPTTQPSTTTTSTTSTPGRAPVATYKVMSAEPGATIDGSLLEGDDLGIPTATLVELSSLGDDPVILVGDEVGVEILLRGEALSGAIVTCGELTFSADGDYSVRIDDVVEPARCSLDYRIGNVVASDGSRVDIFVGLQPPVATDKTVNVISGQGRSGLLTEGDDLGRPGPATVTSAWWQIDSNSFMNLDVGGSGLDMTGTDSTGATVACGHITRTSADEYSFVAADATEEVSCQVRYQLAGSTVRTDGSVTFVVTPAVGTAAAVTERAAPTTTPTSTTTTTTETTMSVAATVTSTTPETSTPVESAPEASSAPVETPTDSAPVETPPAVPTSVESAPVDSAPETTAATSSTDAA